MVEIPAPHAHDKLACPVDAPPRHGTHASTGKAGDDVSVVRIEGNVRVVKHDICKLLATKAGEPYDPQKVAADLRTLFATRDFDDVQATRDGAAVTFVLKERPVVAEVRIDGNSAFDFDTLRKLVLLHTGSPADPADVKDAQHALSSFYDDQGYRSHKVDFALEPVDATHATAHFKITEGAKATIKSITFRGLVVATEGELRPLIDTQSGTVDAPGQVYKEDALTADLLKMTARLYDKGLLQSKIDPPQLTLSPDGKSLSIVLVVHEGPVFKLGTLHVTGDGLAADEPTLLKLIPLKPGDVFARSAVLDGVAKLREFQAQKHKPNNVEPVTDIHADKATVDLTLRVSSS
jgi:outer membrane protein insertion porin family